MIQLSFSSFCRLLPVIILSLAVLPSSSGQAPAEPPASEPSAPVVESAATPPPAANAAPTPPAKPKQDVVWPFIRLGIGVAIVLGLIIAFKVNAFIALISAAIVVSLMSPGPFYLKMARVAEAFGTGAGNIGIVIALAAVNLFLGFCLGCFMYYQLARRGIQADLPWWRAAQGA